MIDHKKNSREVLLLENFRSNLKQLLKGSGLTQSEFCAIVNIPTPTFSNILLGVSKNPSLSTVHKIAQVFGVNVSQLIGELPLNFFETIVPILEWDNINVKEKKIDFLISNETQHISTSLQSKNKAFALRIEKYISDIYNINNIVIFEETNELHNNCEALISLNDSSPSIKKVVLEDDKIYLQSISNNLPLQQVEQSNINIFGIVVEIRFANI